MRTAIRATITHDRETWNAHLGQPLTGQDGDGRPLRSKAVVLKIDPDLKTLDTRGGSDWEPTAQVHGISDVEWVDLEVERPSRDGLAAAIAERDAAGWTHFQTVDREPEQERVWVYFTRPLD